MARLEVSNSSVDDFMRNTFTLTIRGLTDEELLTVSAKLDELGWILSKNEPAATLRSDCE